MPYLIKAKGHLGRTNVSVRAQPLAEKSAILDMNGRRTILEKRTAGSGQRVTGSWTTSLIVRRQKIVNCQRAAGSGQRAYGLRH
jgi:hypothetical protein